MKKRIKYTIFRKFGGKVANLSISKLDFITKKSDPITPTEYLYYKTRIKRGERINMVVVEKKGDRYSIVDGNHRVRALKRLGYKKVRAEIV